MKLFDTHAHLTDERFDEDREQLISSLPGEGVELVLNCATDLADCAAVAQLCERYPSLRAAYGVHPHEAGGLQDGYLNELRGFLSRPDCAAVGEIGLDYHYDFTPRDVQKRRLHEQLELAVSLDLPVVLHDREAHEDLLHCLLPFKGKLRGVLHSYSGSAEMLRQYAPLDLYFGFGGPVTFKNAHKPKEAARAVPADRLLLETDCPYLTPEPFRGKRNNPALVAYTCRAIAALRGVDAEELALTTYENGRRLFSL